MAYDEGLASLLRDELAGLDGVSEKKMFGGIAFMRDGHMVCGVHKGGGMFRVGKERHEQALALPGVAPMAMTGRPMGGMVDASDEAMADDGVRGALVALSLAFVETLPPK